MYISEHILVEYGNNIGSENITESTICCSEQNKENSTREIECL